MRDRLRTAILTAGAGWTIFVIVLAVAAATGSWILAIIGAVLGVVLVLSVCFAAMRFATLLIGNSDRLATRLKKVEGLAGTVEGRTEALEQALNESNTRIGDVESLCDDHVRRITSIEVATADHDRRIAETDTSVVGLEAGLAAATNSFSERGDRHEATQKELAESLDTRSLARDEQIESLRTAIAHGQNAQKRSAVHLDGVRKDVRVLRSRVPSGFLDLLEGEVATLRDETREQARTSFESAIRLGRDPRSFLPLESAQRLFADYYARGDYLKVRPLLDSFDLLPEQNLTTSRAIYRYFRAAGYWELASQAVRRFMKSPDLRMTPRHLRSSSTRSHCSPGRCS